MLNGRVRHDDIPICVQYLTWSGVGSGKVNMGMPSEFDKWRDRLDDLKHRAKVVRGQWTPVPNNNVIAEMRSIYDSLRAVIERVVQDVFLNGAVKRFEDYIQVENLRSVAGLDKGHVTSVIDKYHDVCGLIAGHDRASGSPNSFEIDQLDADIQAVENIANSVKAARKASAR